MKKAWLVLVAASVLLLLLTYFIPNDLINSGTSDEFERLLSEQIQDSSAFNKEVQFYKDTIDVVDSVVLHQSPIDSLKENNGIDSLGKGINAYGYTDNAGLDHFFEKLQKLEQTQKGQIRIAFFGDSMEDGDMIVMQLRHFLQRKFGGMGVGFVPMTSVDARGRYSIKHQFTHNWNKSDFLKKGYGRFHFGVNGSAFYVGDSLRDDKATVKFVKGGAYKELPLINPTLFYGKQKKDETNSKVVAQARVIIQDTTKPLLLQPQKILNSCKLPNLQKEISITIEDQQSIPFYGVSFASDNGVIVDNLSVRGNSGLPLMKLDYDLMRSFDKYLDYDLLVLAYGTNVFSVENKEYGWYQNRMLKIIKYMQKCYKNANVLVMSMGDRSTKIEGEMQTPEHLHNFIQMQHNIAKKSKSGFYSLYHAMGGANSMVRWVEQDSLANKDYTHLNSKGAAVAGKMMYDWFMINYNHYKKQKMKKNG